MCLIHVETDLYATLHLGTIETTRVLETHLQSLPCGINKVGPNVPSSYLVLEGSLRSSIVVIGLNWWIPPSVG